MPHGHMLFAVGETKDRKNTQTTNQQKSKKKKKTRKQQTKQLHAGASEEQPAATFVSHWWGESCRDFVACVEQHARDHRLLADRAADAGAGNGGAGGKGAGAVWILCRSPS